MFILLNQIRKYLYSGHERSARTKKNILLSFFLKPVNIIIQLILVPILIGYLQPEKYGIWITVWSVINWLYLFDIGLGNGLRNKLAEAFANDEKEKAKILISTSYAGITVISVLLLIVFLSANNFINWTIVFNASANLSAEIQTLLIIVFSFFLLNFIFRLIGSILNADQKSAFTDLIYSTGNVLSLILILLFINFKNASLILVGLAIGLSITLPNIAASIFLFIKKYKGYRPSVIFVKFQNLKDLISLGVKFFILQFAGVVVFTTDNLIITHLFGPEYVTPYSVAVKYFSIILILFTIILTPFWSAFTEAFTKGDFDWIKRKIIQLIKFWFFILLIVLIMIFISKEVYAIWIGNAVNISFSLSMLMGLFVLMASWNNIFAYFLNGIGKIRLQMYYGIFAMLINIPVSIFLAINMNFGIDGIILGTCVSLTFGTILGPMQVFKIINRKDTGIWIK